MLGMNQTAHNIRNRMIKSTEAQVLLRQRISAREPASAIRLGDGEGVMLANPSLRHPLLGKYIVSHFGPQVSQSQVDWLSQRLRASCARAFIVGIRPDMLQTAVEPGWFDMPPEDFLQRFLDAFDLRPVERETIGYAGAYRLALLNAVMMEGLLLTDGHLTTAWCHFDWSRSGFLAELVRKEQRIGLISRHDKLAGLIEAEGTKVDFYSIPARYNRHGQGWQPHFPDRFDQILDSLEVVFKGQVFLVGAGICGKIYCDEIAVRGGIGIDIGSVCDSWLGLASRPLVMRSLYETADVPIELTLEYQLHRPKSA
jgi:hypothetical protein